MATHRARSQATPRSAALRRFRVSVILAAVLLLAAPSLLMGQSRSVTTDPDGAERVRIDDLPSLLDRSWQWTTEVEIQVPTDVGGPEPLLYNPSFVFPLAADTLLVFDRAADHPLNVLSLNPLGVVASFGALGEGPREISRMDAVWLTERDGIAVFDAGQPKVLVYSHEGELLDVTPAERSVYLYSTTTDPRSPPLVQWLSEDQDRSRIDLVGRLTLGERAGTGEPEYGPRVVASLQTPPTGDQFQDGRALWTATANGIVSGRSDVPVFEVLDSEGSPVRRIELDLSRRRLGQSEINRQVARAGAIARGLEPGLMGITNDLEPFGANIFGIYQSNLWRAAEDPALDEGQVIWRLVSLDGEYLGTLERSTDFRPTWFEGDAAWGLSQDELGVPLIQRRRVVPPPALERR